MGQFDDLFDDGGDKVRANAALRFGIEAQPDTAARDQVLARRYGLPAAVIEQYRPDYEARAKVEDAAPTLEQSPKLRGWLAEDIARAKVVHDDLDNMGAIEGALKYLVSAPGAPRGGALSDIGRAARAVASGAPNFGAGVYGAAAAPFELVGLDSIGGWLRGQQKSAQGVAAGWMGMSPDAGMVEQSVLSGLQSAGQTLVTLPAGFVNGARVTGEQIMLGLMGLTTGGQSYGKARDAGLAPAQAIPYAVQDATAEIVTEKYLGAAGLLKNIKAGASAGKLFAYELGKEVPGEIGATLWQNFNEWANVNPDKSVGEFLAEQPEDVVRTVIATLVGGTTQIGAIKGLERVVSGAERRLQAAELADTTAQGFEQLHALAAASKVLQRDPDTFEAFVARAAENGPVQDVFISAQTLAQSGVAEQLAQISPSVAAQLAEATVVGGDIRIPVAEYAARIAPSEYAQSLVDHLKTEPGGFSRAEAQAYMQSQAEELQAEVERALTERQADDTFRASADAVKTEIQRQLGDAARFTGQVNDAYASAVSSFYAVTAAKLGITPEELFKQYPLRIQVEGVAGQSYAQDAPELRDLMITHNLSAANLLHAKKMGGIAVPSLAVTKKDTPLDSFGEITLIGPKEMADPKGYAGTKVFGADIYSPRYPSVERDIDSKQNVALRNYIKAWTDKLGGAPDITDLERDGQRTLERNAAMMATFLSENGIEPAIVRKASDLTSARVERLKSFGITDAHLASTDVQELLGDETFVKAAAFELADTYRQADMAARADRLEQNADLQRNVARDLAYVIRNSHDTAPDRYATQQALEKQIDDAGLRKAYEMHVQAWLNRITKGERIYQGFTNSRNRKYVPHTLENVVKILKKELRGGENFNYGVGSLRAKVTPEFKSLAAIKKEKGRLVSAADFEKLKAEIDAEFWATLSTIDKDLSSETGTAILEDAAKLGVKKAAKEYGYEVSDEAAAKVAEFLTKLRDLPTAYFEAKILRDVSPAEFKGAVVPEDIDPDALAYLKTQVEDIRTYKRGDEASRAAAVAGFENLFFQGRNDANRGAFNPATNTITLLKNADLSTFLHEAGHFFLETQLDIAARLGGQQSEGASVSTGEQQILDDTNALLKWFGIESIAEWHSLDFEEKRSYHERFARGFEAYLFEGRAPNIELQGLFQRFRAWLLNVYRDLKNLNVELTDEVRGVMDRMLATTEEIKLAEQARSMMPLFAAPDQAGMTTEEFAAYQDLGTQATADAIQDLQARGMRDMQWLHNAKGREVKRLQRLSADLRREVQMDVRREVMSQPVYRAWQFLTGKLTAEDKLAAPAPRKSDPNVVDETIDSLHTAIAKLGGLRKDEVVAQWGVDPKDKPVSGVFGKPVLRREGGLSIDAMAERLGELGYLPLDENGKTDIRDLEERFDEELRGSPVYSIAHDYSQAQGEQRAGDGVNVAALTAGRLDLVDLQQVLLAGRPAPEPAQRGLLDGELGQGSNPLKDGDGNPLVLYHGSPTRKAGKKFDLAQTGKRTDYGNLGTAVYLTPAEFVAKAYAGRTGSSEAFYVADGPILRVPYDENYQTSLERVAADLGVTAKAEWKGAGQVNPEWSAQFAEKAKAAGYVAAAGTNGDGSFAEVAVFDPANLQRTDGGVLNQSPKNQPPVARDATTEQIVERLVSLGMTRKTGGLHPDIVAELFGFASGEEMVRALAEAQPPKAEIEALTDARMLEQHGELASPEAIDRAADKALHNDARQRFVATELAALEKATGKTRTLTTAAKQFAEAMVSRLRVRDIRPAQYSSAEARAAKLAQKAAKANDLATAAAEKRNQLVNGYASVAAHAAQEEVAKIDAFFKRIANGKDDPSRDADIVAAARAVLATFGYGGKAKSAAEYLRAVREYDPALADVLAGSVEAAQALADQTQRGAPTIEDLPLERLRALNDEIASLWHLAKRNRQMEVDGDMLDRQEIAEQLNARLVELGLPESMPGDVQAVTPEEQRAMNFASARAIGRRVESWVDRLDGSAKMGAFRRFLWTPIKEAADRYRADKAAYLREFRQAFDRIAPTMKAGLISAPELGYTFGKDSGGVALNEILHAMLHTGNASNKRKLLLGRGWAEEGPDGTLDTSRWDAFIARMVAEGRIRREHFDFVQATWDLLERTKPLAQRAHRDAYGKYFAEVTAEPFTDPFGVQRAGGYAPAQVDSRIVKDNELKKLVEEGKEGMAYTFPGTTKGFTKSRVEYNRPLMLDLRTLPQHIDKVLLFGHLEMPVRDAAKLLASKGLAQSLNRADPAAITAMLMPWLNRTARQQVTTPIVGAGWMMRMLNTLRNRTSMATMFANVSNTMQQVTGFMLAGLKVPGRAMLASAADYMRAPRQTAEEVAELSVYMRNRMNNEVSAMLGEIDAILLDPSLYQRAQAWTTRHTFFLQSAVDNVMGPIIWKAAYTDALEQKFDPRDAVRIADAAVRQTQGSTLPEDVSRIETGPAYARLFTQFAGYFNMQANLLGTEFAKVSQEMGLRKGMGRGFFILVLGFYAPALVAEAIAQAFRGGPGDEDKDGEYLDDWLMSLIVYGPMRNITAFVPFVGAAVNSAVARFNDNPVDDRVSVAPVVGAIEGAAGVPAGLYQAATDEAKAQRVVKDVATLVTITTGLPASVAARPVSYLAGVAQGKVQPTGPLDAARGLLTGAASPESRQP